MFLLLYTLSALAAMTFLFWQTYGEKDHFDDDIDEEKYKAMLIFFAIFWPITMTMICVMSLWGIFTNNVQKKVNKLYDDYQTPDDFKIYKNEDDEIAGYSVKNKAIQRMTSKELEYLLFAEKIKAIDLHETSKNLVERLLADRAFEKEVLEK